MARWVVGRAERCAILVKQYVRWRAADQGSRGADTVVNARDLRHTDRGSTQAKRFDAGPALSLQMGGAALSSCWWSALGQIRG
jgi:hypothetical protein